MSTDAIAAHTLGAELAKVGLLPKECFNVELKLPVDGLAIIHFEMFVHPDDMSKLILALTNCLNQLGGK